MSLALSPAPARGDVTQLLHSASGGDRGAYDRLFSLAFGELQRIAERQLRGSAQRRSLDAGELVSELYLKMGDQLRVDWQGRAHFYAIAARAMRQILVDMARRRMAAKRGGSWAATTLTGKELPGDLALEDVLMLDQSLERLDERQRQVVELRFFAGLSEEEIARALGVSTRTVQREWTKARAWLYREIYAPGGDPAERGDG
jgi:RNA polymerase sigma factor (TIGR02999 family)